MWVVFVVYCSLFLFVCFCSDGNWAQALHATQVSRYSTVKLHTQTTERPFASSLNHTHARRSCWNQQKKFQILKAILKRALAIFLFSRKSSIKCKVICRLRWLQAISSFTTVQAAYLPPTLLDCLGSLLWLYVYSLSSSPNQLLVIAISVTTDGNTFHECSMELSYCLF